MSWQGGDILKRIADHAQSLWPDHILVVNNEYANNFGDIIIFIDLHNGKVSRGLLRIMKQVYEEAA